MSESDRPLRLLGFEPFHTGSHRAVVEAISLHSSHDWNWLTSRAHAWKWRMRLAAIEMTDDLENMVAPEGPCDVVFATSLLSLADLRAFWNRAGLPNAKFVLYMHENQAAYPEGHATQVSRDRDVHFALTNLTSILAADLTIFNSQWNRDSFLDGIEALLGHAPSPHPTHKKFRARIESTSLVLWPPVEGPPGDMGEVARPSRDQTEPVRVVWPHRWEHDKGPDELLDLARSHTERANLRWTILGESFKNMPESLRVFQDEFRDRIDHIGFVEDRDAYWKHLRRCDWVLSTARHEFFGIAVVEAMLAGCLPWLPERLSYPELLPENARGLSPMQPPHDDRGVRHAIRAHLEPALAPNAVAKIDAALQCVVRDTSSS